MISKTAGQFIGAALVVAATMACGGRPVTKPSPDPSREVRLLEADDPALSPVLFAAAGHIFDPKRGDGSFGGVFVNNQLVRPLTLEIIKYVNWSHVTVPDPDTKGVSFTSVRIAADTAYVETRIGGRAGVPWCLPFVVDQAAGGWRPADGTRPFNQTKPSKAGQCGR